MKPMKQVQQFDLDVPFPKNFPGEYADIFLILQYVNSISQPLEEY